jgi:LysM repeat protein
VRAPRILRSALKSVVLALAGCAAVASTARGEVPHTVQPGETLWSIAAANNFTTRTVAVYNGLSESSRVYVGETIQIPTEAEGAVVVASAGTTAPTSTSTTSSGTSGASHTVTSGESLSSIAAANGLSTDTLAANNGLSATSGILIGQTIQVPASSGSSTSTGTTATGTTSAPTPPPPQEHPYWTSPIYCPSCPNGEAYLASNAAAAWDAMRQASQRLYGIDLYPDGPFSAYRSYAQQAYLYDLYLSGRGNLAAPPGSSSHEYGYALDLADPSMRTVVDQIGADYGWAKIEAPEEWWHVNFVGG